MVIMKVKVISSELEVQRTPSLPRTGSLYKFKFLSLHQPNLHFERFLQVVSVFYGPLQKFDISYPKFVFDHYMKLNM